MTVLPEPERGAAMTRPLAKTMPPRFPDIPVQRFPIAADRPEHDDRGGWPLSQRPRRGQCGFDHRLLWRRRMRHDGHPVTALAPGSNQFLRNRAEMLDRH